jgi:vancomycin resistance protein YoaR
VREAVLVPGGERFVVQPGRDAVRVDTVAGAQAIDRAVFSRERTVALPAEITHPSLTTEAAQAFADTVTLAGAFTTYFPVNWARATNIGAAAATFDGMAVMPGESFSFWDRIGEVSVRTGYVYAGTIIGGVSSYAIGGGLCQVSTTFFNAVIRGGYRIDERHQHSYYIERYPLGLDAAVFAGEEDMRWTNDTSAPVYIRAQGTDTSITFWLYSAPTGRSVEIGDVQQWNLRWPYPGQPADPQHAPGYVVPGRDTLVIRTVFQDGAAVSRDEWYSHYAPVWGGPG